MGSSGLASMELTLIFHLCWLFRRGKNAYGRMMKQFWCRLQNLISCECHHVHCWINWTRGRRVILWSIVMIYIYIYFYPANINSAPWPFVSPRMPLDSGSWSSLHGYSIWQCWWCSGGCSATCNPLSLRTKSSSLHNITPTNCTNTRWMELVLGGY